MNNTLPTNLTELLTFYSAIPEERWGVGHYALKSAEAPCAIGHWARAAGIEGVYDDVYTAFDCAFPQFSNTQLWEVNDDCDRVYAELGDTPKKRVIAYIKGLIAGGAQ